MSIQEQSNGTVSQAGVLGQSSRPMSLGYLSVLFLAFLLTFTLGREALGRAVASEKVVGHAEVSSYIYAEPFTTTDTALIPDVQIVEDFFGAAIDYIGEGGAFTVFGVASATPVGMGTGTIAGVVFSDINGNSEQEEGEPGLGGRLVRLHQDGAQISEVRTETRGHFAFKALSPGDYKVTVELQAEVPGLCADAFGGFNPLRIDACAVGGSEQWVATEAAEVQVSVAADETAEAKFGLLRATDYITGQAILNGDYAAPGTAIRATFAGVECGESQVTSSGGNGNLAYSLELLTSAGRDGCPRPGDSWALSLGDQTAGSVIWDTDCCGPPLFVDLIAMPDHAWFWAEDVAEGSIPEGTLVQALVGSVLCGEARVETTLRFGEPWVGFQKLLVPSESIKPGCGEPGAQLTFVIGEHRQTKNWLAGSVQQIELLAPPQQPKQLPVLGGHPGDRAGNPYLLTGIGILATILGLAAIVVAGREQHD